MAYLLLIAGIILIAYLAFRAKSNKTAPPPPLPTPRAKLIPDVNPQPIGIKIGFSDNDYYPAIYALMSIYESINQDTSGTTPTSQFYRFKRISQSILELENLTKQRILAHSKAYTAIINDYNQVVDKYKNMSQHLKTIALEGRDNADLNHCPSCNADIGKEVTRARACPNCKQRIILYRIGADNRVLINNDKAQELKEYEASIASLHIPDILQAYDLPPQGKTELVERIKEIDQRAALNKQAESLNIDIP